MKFEKLVNRWFFDFRESSLKMRLKLVDILLSGIRDFKSKDGKVLGEDIYKNMIKNSDLIGVVGQVSYIRVKGSMTESVFNHPFAAPTLLYHLKSTNLIFMISPGLRFNDSILSEEKLNGYNEDVEGITA
jgi:hypothetical protein